MKAPAYFRRIQRKKGRSVPLADHLFDRKRRKLFMLERSKLGANADGSRRRMRNDEY